LKWAAHPLISLDFESDHMKDSFTAKCKTIFEEEFNLIENAQ
jgi:hypothetical protein